MAQHSKGRILKLLEDIVDARDSDGNVIEGKKEKRIRAQFMPSKPDAVFINLSKAEEGVINTFRALAGKPNTVFFPSRTGVYEGNSYTSLASDCTVEDIEVMAVKPTPTAAQTTAQPQR